MSATTPAVVAAREAVDRAYALHDTLYGADQKERARVMGEAQAEASRLLSACEEAELTEESPPELRALLWCLRGKVATLGAEGRGAPDAEALLADAVKLDPSLADAWNCLGECFWHRNELEMARHTFLGALSHERTPATLCHLSMLLRTLASVKQAEAPALLEESVTLAKEAVRRDARSAAAWKGLGCAHMAVYSQIAHSAEELHFATKALAQAAKAAAAAASPPSPAGSAAEPPATGAADGGGGADATEANPAAVDAPAGAEGGGVGASADADAKLVHADADLHMLHGNALYYLDDFERAMEHYGAAEALDRTLGGGSMRQEAWDFVVNVSSFLSSRAGVKPKRLAALAAELPLPAPPETCTVGQLSLGPNAGKTLSVKVVAALPQLRAKHLRFVVVDRDEQLVALSVYGMRAGLVQVDATLEVRDPQLLQVQAHHWDAPAQTAGYHTLRVVEPRVQLRVNGSAIIPRHKKGQ